MDVERAKYIMKSSETIEVLYQGSPVWIENVRTDNTAEITYLESDNREDVSVYELAENKPINI